MMFYILSKYAVLKLKTIRAIHAFSFLLLFTHASRTLFKNNPYYNIQKFIVLTVTVIIIIF